MDITYLGHSSFKLRTTNATVVTDPYNKEIGLEMPRVSADVVTVSHQHDDHNATNNVSGTSRRENPFIVESPGEYEVGGVSVFGIKTYHDDQEGALRGDNNVYSILIDGVSIIHLGDLGHTVTQKQIADLGTADVLLCPVGGHYTLDPKKVSELINVFEPSIFIPMHFKTPAHDPKTFGDLITLDEFVKDFGTEPKKADKLSVTKTTLPEDMEMYILEV